MALPLEGVAHQPGSQEDRHHVHHPGPRHAPERLRRRPPDAISAGLGCSRFAGLSSPGPLQPDLHRPRLDHDCLHGHAFSLRPDEPRGSPTDRRPRRGLSFHEFGQPLAHNGRGRAGHGVPGTGRVFQGRVVGVPLPDGIIVQPRHGGGLLAVGLPDRRSRLSHERHQLPCDHHENARAGNGPDANAHVRLDHALHHAPHPLRLSGPHRLPGPAGARPLPWACTFSRTPWAAT